MLSRIVFIMQRIKKLGVENLNFQMIISKNNFGEIINLPNKRADPRPSNQTGWKNIISVHAHFIGRSLKNEKIFTI